MLKITSDIAIACTHTQNETTSQSGELKEVCRMRVPSSAASSYLLGPAMGQDDLGRWPSAQGLSEVKFLTMVVGVGLDSHQLSLSTGLDSAVWF